MKKVEEGSRERVILYGCGQETEKFLKNYHDIKIEFCIDDKLSGQNFHEFSIYSFAEKKNELKSNHVLIFTDDITIYKRISNKLRTLGLKEFQNFIPYYLFRKKVALTWGNCHVEYVRSFLTYSKAFSEDYAFYPKKNLWDMKDTDVEADIFKYCDLLVCQHIRQENKLGESFSSMHIEGRLKEGCKVIKFPNLYGLPEFLFPQTYMDNVYINRSGGIQWYRDKVIDNCIKSNICDIETIYQEIQKTEFSTDEIMNSYFEFMEKLFTREKQCNIHIYDYIMEHIRDEQLFLDVEHPSKRMLGEIGNRVLEYMGYPRLDSNLLLDNVYGHEVLTYPCIKKYFHMTWENGDIKRDNKKEKLFPVYMDMKEYIRQYCLIYTDMNGEE